MVVGDTREFLTRVQGCLRHHGPLVDGATPTLAGAVSFVEFSLVSSSATTCPPAAAS